MNPIQLFRKRKGIPGDPMNLTNAMLGVQEATGDRRDPADIRVVSSAPRVGGGSAGDFEDSPIDLSEIGRAYYSDSYVMRAVNKIVGLMFKSGWHFNSSNRDALEYVERRFELIAESTEITTNDLIRETGLNYVLYANTALVKVRGVENIADLEAEGYYGGDPIAGIFNIPIERLQVQRDAFGNIERYLILSDEGDDLELAPEDVLHITYNKPTGRTYGVPHISSVLDDVLILRQIEENVVRMIYRNINPLMAYKVGLAEPGYEATDEEIDMVAAQIENMSLDSMLILSERHNVEAVSSNSAILDAFDYLRYFRQRVFTGLGVSESTMGIGDSSNRSTADNQSSDLIDLVKDFQINFQSGIQKLINEILFEGGFDPVLEKEDQVMFEFVEIEQSVKIARENHELQKFLANAQSIDKYMENIGEDPISDEELGRFYKNLFGEDRSDSAQGAVDNKDRPENQHGKQDAPPETPEEMHHINEKQLFENKSGKLGLTIEENNLNVSIDDEKTMHEANKLKVKLTELFNELYESNSPEHQIKEKWLSSFPNNVFESEEDRETFVYAVEKATSTESFESKDDFFMLEEAIIIYYNHLREGKNENT